MALSKTAVGISILVACMSAPTIYADDIAPVSSAPETTSPEKSQIPERGFFVGAGFGVNNVTDKFTHQEANTDPLNPQSIQTSSTATDTTPNFTAQLGFFDHFSESNWLWASKIFFSSIDASFYPNSGFWGQDVDYQIGLLPFMVGYSVSNFYIEGGLGVAYQQQPSTLFVEFGTPGNPSTSLGSGPDAGYFYPITQLTAGYYFSKNWSIEGSYTSVLPVEHTNTSMSGTFSDSETSKISSNQFTFSINRNFSF